MLRELSDRSFEGFILCAHLRQPVPEEVWYGLRVDQSLPHPFENIKSNGLQFFPDLDSTCESMKALKAARRRFGFSRVGLAELKLAIVQNEEAQKLRSAEKLVVVVKTDGGVEFMGRPVEGIPGVAYAPCSDLLRNGIQPFTDFDLACRAGYEIQRQGHTPACLASFDFRRVRGVSGN